jgi:hypothetical protein
MEENKKVPKVIRKLPTDLRRRHFTEKVILCSAEVAEERLNKCKSCSSFKDYGCEITGFFMPRQTRLKSASCPYGYWPAWYSNEEKK